MAFLREVQSKSLFFDTAEQQALAIHGTLIGNKLKARAQKRSGVSQES
jgi:hypothetical protein